MTAAAQGSADAVALITAICAYGQQTYADLADEVTDIPAQAVLAEIGRLNTRGPA